jgi:hypothetical protein
MRLEHITISTRMRDCLLTHARDTMFDEMALIEPWVLQVRREQ